MEGEIRDCVVEGEIPTELAGTYYRNGPNPQFPQLESYHVFDGDGMIHAFEIGDGVCHYRNRWVRTERFTAERSAGERLFNGLMSGLPPDPRAEGVSGNTANTNILWHGGRLLALWEGGAPYALDPDTLETVGVYDFDGGLARSNGGGSVTAHPKIDPKTGEMVFFGYHLTAPYLSYGVADAAGRLTRRFDLDSPHPSMLHDFLVTDEHVVFPVFPNTFSFENFAKTGVPMAWEPERGTHLGVMPRSGGADDVVWLQTEPCNAFHFLNAYSENGRIIADVCRFDALPLFGMDAGRPELRRWTLDPAAGTVCEDTLDDFAVDFPRIDDRFAGLRHRQGWFSGALGPTGEFADGFFNTVIHYDFEHGTRKHVSLAEGDNAGEPVFIPRRPDAEEGDGFVVFLAYRGNEKRSDLLIFDAQNIDDEPLASVRLPHAVPLGFHGNWRPAA
jgi:carotenoid cleavage dioxygenase